MILGIGVAPIILLGGILVFTLAVVKLAAPVDSRLSKRYVGKVLTIMEGKNTKVKSLKVKSLPPPEMTPELEDKAEFSLEIETSEGETLALLAQAYYPRTSSDLKKIEQQQKSGRPQEEEGELAYEGRTTGFGEQTLLENTMRDQQSLEEEEKEVQVKLQRYEASIKALGDGYQVSKFIPKLHFYDKRKVIAFTEYIGNENLKAKIIDAPWELKKEYLSPIVTELAHTHVNGQEAQVKLPYYYTHSYELLMGLVEEALSRIPNAGRAIDMQQWGELLPLFTPIASFVDNQAEKGFKLSNCSPYNLIVSSQTTVLRDWEGVRRDVIALDLVELLRDPVTNISLEEEQELLQVYIETRKLLQPSFDASNYNKEYYLVAAANSLSFAGHIAEYLSWIRRREAQNEEIDIDIAHWDMAGLQLLLQKVVASLSKYQECKPFIDKFKDASGNLLIGS